MTLLQNTRAKHPSSPTLNTLVLSRWSERPAHTMCLPTTITRRRRADIIHLRLPRNSRAPHHLRCPISPLHTRLSTFHACLSRHTRRRPIYTLRARRNGGDRLCGVARGASTSGHRRRMSRNHGARVWSAALSW